MSKINFLVLGLVFSFAVSPSYAEEVRLDQNIKDFLLTKSDAVRPVLVLYKNFTAQMQAPTLAEKVNFTKAQERKVFGSMPSLARAQRDTLWLVNGTIASLNTSQLQEIIAVKASENISAIYSLGREAKIQPLSSVQILDGYRTITWGLELIGLIQWKAAFPQITGKGVRVGIIDTGIDPKHPDLKGRTVNFKDFANDTSGPPFDDNGHGTHIAGTIVGKSSSRVTIGMAPDTDLVVAKAFSARGSALDSRLLLALQWMADPDGDPLTADSVRMINNSWNFSDDYRGKNPGDEPFCLAIDQLDRLGILNIISAGNYGPGAGTVAIPGSCPKTLTVGAIDEGDNVANFSSRGPARWKQVQLAKPDIVAPGVKVLSAYPDMFATMTGTSMAVPHVVGALAMLAQAHPELDNAGITKLLLENTKDLGDAGLDSAAGFGRLDLLPFVKNQFNW